MRSLATAEASPAGAMEALRELRATRRRRFVEDLDVMEVLYRAYVVVIFGSIGLFLIAGAIDDAPLGPAALDDMAERGPAVLGLAVALAALAGLRSGSRGGPLAIEAAEVQHVLLAPVDRGAALRPAAYRQARMMGLSGAALGIAVGAFAVSRLPGSPVEWMAVLAAFGALLPLCYLGPALLASGRRIGPLPAGVLGLVLCVWVGVDLWLGSTTCPATMLGALATLPLQSGMTVTLAAVGAAVAAAAFVAGLVSAGGLSLDLAKRRATLAAELRFSATVQDLRTVVLLRRQLASERPRRRPWLRLAALGRLAAPVERRALRSLLRWPAARLARALAIGVLAGLVAAAIWDGTTPLVVVPGALLLLAALDLIEPLAQEVDHPTRRDLLPLGAGALTRRHLVVPSLAMAIVMAAAALTVLALGASGTEVAAALAVILPTGLLLICCAALSVTNDPYRYLLTPRLGYVQTGAPVAVAVVAAGVPLLVAREATRYEVSPLAAVISVEVVLLALALGLGLFLSSRVAAQAKEAGR
jgi:hypothetical protein